LNEILLKLVKQSRFSLKLCVKEVPEVGIKYSMHDQPFWCYQLLCLKLLRIGKMSIKNKIITENPKKEKICGFNIFFHECSIVHIKECMVWN